MTVKEYTEACLEFARATKTWGGMRSGQFYVTTGRGWVETCDNSEAGVRIDWAFGQTSKYIKENAAQEFVDTLWHSFVNGDGINGDGESAVAMLKWLAKVMS